MDLALNSDLAFAIRKSLVDALQSEVPDLAPFFPFRFAFAFDALRSGGRIALRLIDVDASSFPVIGGFENRPDLRAVAQEVLDGVRDPAALRSPEWWSARRFSYVGPEPTGADTNWPPLWAEVVDWVNEVAAPEVLEMNRTRVLRAVPDPPRYDSRLLESVVVVDDRARQGTAFNLAGVGFITCDHVLFPASEVFLAADPSRRLTPRVIGRNSTIDLAVLEVDLSTPALARGSGDTAPLYSQIAALGFPNYQLGDTGVLMPGIIVGHRPRSGVRRILTNGRIVGGMSGGPVVDGAGTVIGVCVTGADRLEVAEETEDHGIIPIDALDLL